jgi:hypothetical protein
VRVLDDAKPGFFEQVLRNVAAPGQAGQEVEQPRVERVIDVVEGLGIARSQAYDNRGLGRGVHIGHNAGQGPA